MGRRGRPPYPDILTPRQWEVLDLVRHGLSDQQIADELELTLAGAKYHVSEILTKLGVSTREEAAAWQPPEARARWWRRALALSLTAKIAGAALVIVAAVGIGLLSWGTLRTDDSGNATALFADLALPSPPSGSQLTPELALVEASQHTGGDIRAADVQFSTMTDIAHAVGDTPPLLLADQAGWLVRMRGYGGALLPGIGGGEGSLNQGSSAVTNFGAACSESWAYFPDLPETDPGWSMASSGGPALADSACDVQMTDNAAVVLANIALSGDLRAALPDRVQVLHTPLVDAVARFHDRGVATTVHPDEGGDDIWLVVMMGHFFGASSPTPVPATPRPTPAPSCRIAMAIVSADGVLASGSAPSTDC